MNRIVFLQELENRLQSISKEEREDALQYYQNYFDDAGYENEADVIAELGSPEKVAATILADAKTVENNTEFTECGYENGAVEKDTPVAHGSYTYGESQNGTYTSDDNENKPWTNKWLKLLLIVLIVLVAVPIAGPLAVGAIGVVLGCIVAIFGIFLALVVGSIALCIAGAALIVLGIMKVWVALPVALVVSGIGVLLFTIGVIATVVSVKIVSVALPALIRGIVYVCRLPFRNRQRRAA